MKVRTPNVAPGVVKVPEPYRCRCPLKLKYSECELACVNYVDYAIKMKEMSLELY